MMQRIHSWPQRHWRWPVDVTHKHGVRCGDMILVGGQVDLDAEGRVRHADDLMAQVREAMAYLERVLDDLGAGTADLVKLVVYYVPGSTADHARLLERIAASIDGAPGPVVSLIPLPALAYAHMVVEIEAIAMRGAHGEPLTKRAAALDAAPVLPAPLSHALRCGDMVFIGQQSALDASGDVVNPEDLVSQSGIVMTRMGGLLSRLGAGFDDVVKLNRHYVAPGTAAQWEASALACARFFEEPGPAATGVPLPALMVPGAMISVEACAMPGAGGRHEVVWPPGHWDWPVHLPYKHGIRCGPMIHVGGQVSLDSSGGVIDPGDMVAQTRTAMGNIAIVLAGFGATLDDVVKVTAFYQGDANAQALHRNFLVRSESFSAPGPATTGVPLPALAYEDMVIEIEVIAMREAPAR